MKNLILFFALIMLSCSDNKKENLYNIIDEILIDEIEMGAKDLDLKIVSLKKAKDDNTFTANDSIWVYKSEIKELEQKIKELKDYTYYTDKTIFELNGKFYFAPASRVNTFSNAYPDAIIKTGSFEEKKQIFNEDRLSRLKDYEKEISSLNLNIERLNLEPEKIIFNYYEVKLSIIYNPYEKVKVKKTYKYIISFGLDNRVFDYDDFYNRFDLTERMLLKNGYGRPD